MNEKQRENRKVNMECTGGFFFTEGGSENLEEQVEDEYGGKVKKL